MYKIFVALVNIIWILDILNMPFMELLDTTIPMNGLAWFLIFMAMPLANDSKK